MIEYVLYATAAVALPAAALVGWASRKPDSFRYSRSRAIAARPERIFPLINDVRTMNTWNPFAKAPGMTGAYSGPAAGPGATFAFEGRKSGTGHIAITEASAPARVAMRLVMTKPMRCDNVVEFTLEPRGGETVVTWTMQGAQPLPSKLMSCFIDCERMCGDQFDKGLADLKAMAEASGAAVNA